MIEFACPHCKKVLKIPDEYVGRWGKCNFCKEKIQITPTAKEPPPLRMAQRKEHLKKEQIVDVGKSKKRSMTNMTNASVAMIIGCVLLAFGLIKGTKDLLDYREHMRFKQEMRRYADPYVATQAGSQWGGDFAEALAEAQADFAKAQAIFDEFALYEPAIELSDRISIGVEFGVAFVGGLLLIGGAIARFNQADQFLRQVEARSGTPAAPSEPVESCAKCSDVILSFHGQGYCGNCAKHFHAWCLSFRKHTCPFCKSPVVTREGI